MTTGADSDRQRALCPPLRSTAQRATGYVGRAAVRKRTNGKPLGRRAPSRLHRGKGLVPRLGSIGRGHITWAVA
jgi:hypothetical protein